MADYYTRALKSRDPRYKTALDRMGYNTRQMVADEPKAEDLTELRAAYADAVGKKAYHGWDADTLREKIKEAETADDEGSDD